MLTDADSATVLNLFQANKKWMGRTINKSSSKDPLFQQEKKRYLDISKIMTHHVPPNPPIALPLLGFAPKRKEKTLVSCPHVSCWSVQEKQLPKSGRK